MTERYCVYHVPDPLSALYSLGSAALGRCIRSGKALGPPWAEDGEGEFPPHPAKCAIYGFHATLVAPFRSLAARSELEEALEGAASGLEAVPLGRMELKVLAPGFPALAPAAQPGALGDLAAELVRSFSGFRRRAEPGDLARRGPLTARQRELAWKWGYPFVMDEFRYHLTLGDCLRAPGAAGAAEGAPGATDPRTLSLMGRLSALLGKEAGSGLAADALCLARQDRAGAPFDILAEYALKPRRKPARPFSRQFGAEAQK
ncbi:MAG: DUF1045 domain-containing protein [Deltaproteobacteria bacterium]|jgi:hypothetical protein|nr:DUF1045 domain-containing protein [Deltaproteobacteria bacterium]